MTLLAGGILLGVLIFFHELGHFVVAKLSGVRVVVFSLGFGPRLFGIRHGDTDYRVSLLPLGGYVRMFGDDITEEIPLEDRQYSFLHKPLPQRMAIAAAGPIANFLLPIVALFFLVIGTETVSDAVVGTVLPDEPAAQAGMVVGDRIVRVSGHSIATFTDLQEHVEGQAGQKLEMVVVRGDDEVTLHVVPRPATSSNPLERDEKVGRIGIMPLVQLPHIDVVTGSAAAAAGLASRDRIDAVGDIKVTSGLHLLSLLDAAAAAQSELQLSVTQWDADKTPAGLKDAAVDIVVTRPETPLVMTQAEELGRFAVTRDELNGDVQKSIDETLGLLAVRRTNLQARLGIGLFEGSLQHVEPGSSAAGAGLVAGDRVVTINGVQLTHAGELQTRLGERPKGIHVLGVVRGTQTTAAVLRMGSRTERGLEDFKTLGASAGSAYGMGATITRDVGPVEALQRATVQTGELIRDTAKGLWMLLTLQVSFKSLGGPITIFSLAGRAMEMGHERFIMLMCFISVNLGIVNLLPVPVLDGGHLLMFAIEGIRRRELSLAAKERAIKVGFATLLVLMAAAIFNDLMRFFV